MPTANQTPDPAPFRMSSTGESQEVGGGGDKTSLILKSPSASSATRFELLAIAVLAGPQNRVAKTLAPALVPIPLPAARSRPRPLTLMRP